MLLTRWIVAAAAATTLLLGQTAETKQAQPKSPKEAEAINAIFSATDTDGRIKAVDALLLKYADTQFKGLALFIATDALDQAGDWEKTVIYGDRALEADPKSYGTMLILARGYASHTREFDFDKEEKLGKADKYANGALKLIPTAGKLQPQIPDDQWEAQKKNWISEAYETLGLGNTIRKKYDDAIGNFNKALEATPNNPNVMVRLATAQTDAKKYDDAIATLDKVLAQPNLNPTVKSIAEGTKKRALASKGAK